jgi:P-type Cu2+ transporter
MDEHSGHQGHHEHAPRVPPGHSGHAMEPRERAHPVGHEAGHGHDHGAMIADFRRRFWTSLALTVPVLALSPMIQHWLGVEEAWAFPGDRFLLLGLSSVIYFYGDWPFLRGLFGELRRLRPGMPRRWPAKLHVAC